MIRRASGVGALVLWWALLLVVFCDIPLRAPWRARGALSLPGSAFTEKLGRAHSLDQELSIDAPGADFSALQVRDGERLAAAERPILHYRFARLPRTLELSFVFRRADQPDDVQTVALPWPVDGSGSFDLRRVPAWRGEILEFGFSEFATAQVVPREVGFARFALERATLEARSWRGAFAVKRSDWFGYWPWALRSINALGPDAAAPRGSSFTVFLALGGAGTIALLAFALRWQRRRLMLAWLAGALAVWIALDLRWLVNLAARHAGTRAVYAGKTADERAALVPDAEVRVAAERVRGALADAPQGAKVFVDAASDYDRARLVYHLQPLNTGPVNVVGYGTAAQREGAYFVQYRPRAYLHYDAGKHALVGSNDEVLPVKVLLEAGELGVYRFVAGVAP